MELHHSFQQKFASVSPVKSKVPIACSLRQYLENETGKIERIVARKQNQQEKVERISSANLQYREQLRQKIQAEQLKHAKNRAAVNEKKVKRQAFKIKEVIKKKQAHDERLRAEKVQLLEQCEKNKQQTRQFWSEKAEEKRSKFRCQSAVEPSYEEAVSRRKSMERTSECFGEITKEQLLCRHNNVNERVQSPLKEYEHQLRLHNKGKVEENQEKHSELLSRREDQFVKDICRHQDQSQMLVRQNDKKWAEKLKRKKELETEHIHKTQENFKQRQVGRAKSMKDCKCHERGTSDLAESIIMKDDSKAKPSTSMGLRNWSVMSMRKSMVRSTLHEESVKLNKETLRQHQERRDEKRLMAEKEIAEALSMRHSIRDESNCWVRKSRQG